MNLLEALEIKNALESIISDLLDTLPSKLHDRAGITEILSKIDNHIEKFYLLEREIEKKYSSTMITPTESVSDIISYADCFSKKVDVLKGLLLLSNKELITTGNNTDIDISVLISTIKQYEEIKNTLIKKVRDRCELIILGNV